MFGLGKPRSKLGKFLDRNGITQEELVKLSKKNRDTVSELCDGSKNVQPHSATQIKIIGALRRMGFDVRREDFWA